MENPRPGEEKIIKDIRNLFRQKKKETKAIKDRIVRDIKNEEHEEQKNYHKPIKVSNI